MDYEKIYSNDPNNFARYINCVHAICNGDYEVSDD